MFAVKPWHLQREVAVDAHMKTNTAKDSYTTQHNTVPTLSPQHYTVKPTFNSWVELLNFSQVKFSHKAASENNLCRPKVWYNKKRKHTQREVQE